MREKEEEEEDGGDLVHRWEHIMWKTASTQRSYETTEFLISLLLLIAMGAFDEWIANASHFYSFDLFTSRWSHVCLIIDFGYFWTVFDSSCCCFRSTFGKYGIDNAFHILRHRTSYNKKKYVLIMKTSITIPFLCVWMRGIGEFSAKQRALCVPHTMNEYNWEK